MSGPYPLMTPRACSRSRRAWIVPRATASRRDASSTPTRGSSANSRMIRASSASKSGVALMDPPMGRTAAIRRRGLARTVQTAQCVGAPLRILTGLATLRG